jgi:hypothetical protein
MIASNEQLARLRSNNQWSRARLAIYKPNVIYTARLASLPASNNRVMQIAFNSGSGTLSDVKQEMTLWVGTSAGAKDLGTCRIRKAPISGTFYIGVTSEIVWQSNAYLTVVDHFPLRAKPVRMGGGKITMDGDVAYTDQSEEFHPVPVMGTHAVAFLEGDDVEVEFDASDSYVFDNVIASYSWSAPGSASISGGTTDNPTITYDAPGCYAVYCTVTSSTSKAWTGVRHVIVFDAEHPPISAEIRSPSGDYDTGGWMFSARMYANADPSEIIDGALCALIAEDWYGGEKLSMGTVSGRENVVMWGYIAGESIEWNPEGSSVEFTVTGPHEWLKQINAQPVSLFIATDTPDDWTVMPTLTVDRALWHILTWRSNVTSLLDVSLTGDTRRAPSIETMEGSLWAQMSEIAYGKIYARLGCDRYGRLFAQIDPQMVPTAARTWDTLMTLTKKDWAGRVNVSRSPRRKSSMFNTSGWRVDASGSVTTLYSLAMGHIHAQYGAVEAPIDQVLVSSQAQANTQAGLFLGWRNNPYGNFDISLAQNNRLIDLYPRQFLDIDLAAEDNPRGIAYAGNLIPRSITLQWDAEALSFTTELTCEAETFPEPAVNGDIPDAEDIDLSIPTLPGLPPFPDIDPIVYPPPSEENENHPEVVVIATDQGVFWTDNFDDDGAEVVWQAMNSGLSDDERTMIGQLVVTPGGALYIMTYGGVGGLGWERVMRASGIGGSWVSVFEATEEHADAFISGLGVNPTASDSVAIVAGQNYVNFGTLDTHHIWVGGGGGFTQGDLIRHKFNYYHKAVVFWQGGWHVFGHHPSGIGGSSAQPRMWRYTPDGTLDLIDVGGEEWGISVASTTGHIFASVGGDKVVAWGGGSDGYTIIHDVEGLTQDHITTQLSSNPLGAAAMSPTGAKGMGWAGGTLVPYKTTDGAATWQSVSGTVPVGSDVWENCRDDNRWIFGGGIVVRLTLDQGATYHDKMGNLGYIAPLVNITNIRFIR